MFAMSSRPVIAAASPEVRIAFVIDIAVAIDKPGIMLNIVPAAREEQSPAFPSALIGRDGLKYRLWNVRSGMRHQSVSTPTCQYGFQLNRRSTRVP
jgi:hypothetical protein